MTSELINLDLGKIQYLIDLVSKDIEIEKTNYDEGYEPYQRKGLPTQKQCQDHNAEAMKQHSVLKQLYVIAQYTILTEAKMSPSTFGEPGSECVADLCDKKGRPLA